MNFYILSFLLNKIELIYDVLHHGFLCSACLHNVCWKKQGRITHQRIVGRKKYQLNTGNKMTYRGETPVQQD